MDKRTSLSVSAVVATLIMGLPALAAQTGPSRPPDQAAEHQVAKKAAPQPAVPRPAPLDPYRCQPSQDISCTVVRETAQGTLIVTMRRAGPARPPAWTVISGAPPLPGQHPGGTVYVVPNGTPDPASSDHQAWLLPNGAPILD